jgi:hypothetical protein
VSNIDRRLHLLRFHLPYHESEHVLNFAINALCEGTCLQDIELRRNDEVFLDALGADAIPDPTTAGDFCRRFQEVDVRLLMDIIDESRLNVWKRQRTWPESKWCCGQDCFGPFIQMTPMGRGTATIWRSVAWWSTPRRSSVG